MSCAVATDRSGPLATGWRLLEHRSPRGEKSTSTDWDRETRSDPREAILCKRCSQDLSDTDAIFAMRAERATRVFANPHGILHEILTLRYAHDIRLLGPATTDFSWYPGYAWEIAYCTQCQTHLGWSFSSVEPETEPALFWGLLRRAVVQGRSH